MLSNVAVNNGSDAFSSISNHGVVFSSLLWDVVLQIATFIVVLNYLGLAWQRNAPNTHCPFQIRFITIDIAENRADLRCLNRRDKRNDFIIEKFLELGLIERLIFF